MFGPPPPPMEEEVEKKKLPKGFVNILKFIFGMIKETLYRLVYIFKLVWDAQPIILIVMAFMAVFNGVQSIISAYISKDLLDGLQLAATGQLTEFWDLGYLLILQIVFQLFVMVVNAVSNMVTRMSNDLVVNSIKLKIMNKAKTIDLAKFDLPEFYSQLENANREAGMRPISVLNAAFSIVSTLISLIGFIAILWSYLWYAPLLVIIMTLPSAVITYKYRKKMFKYMRHRSKDRRQMEYYSNLLVDKDLVKEVKLFDLSDTFIGKYRDCFKNYFAGIKALILSEGIWGIVIATVTSVVNGGIFLRIAKDVFDVKLTIGDYNLYTGALFSISSNVSSLVSTTASIYEGTLFIDNMISFMNVEPTVVPSVPEPLKVQHHKDHIIEFDHVCFAYPGTNREVIHDVNLTLHTGETVVLVGLNGAGKTTLLKLLTRLYDPTSGVIRLDGHDIKEYDVKDLYSMYGIIFQDFGKYAFTVKENIGFGEQSRADDFDAIKEASVKSNADTFVQNLKEKYDTPLMRIFEREGLELSVGQWQKIAVARAFFRQSDIMILDEPTASLDAMAEQEIFNQFDKLREGKTTIYVSHRLSSATIASKIIVLENGRIVEEGNHRELMVKHGKYADLFMTQAKHYIENVEPPRDGFPPMTDGKRPPMPSHGDRPPMPPHGERPPRPPFEKQDNE